ncbi:thioredoxin domain-containing protein [Novosphingobium sp. FGD1]|jgi:protein-disulfide isomerase|uniref:Thioredoxin domain-containing protein n=1 Tax=Novosphingobium silvae TaxID=2692619 RepID=A0A7X4K625_9SPHN|nr:DsbA family protein [Novosphingobium silvae]MYL96700.1 thioredoxin domain-containing protein [Novosphingobium silvae]
MGNASKFAIIAGCLVLVGVGGWYGGRAAVENVVHDYILGHPEILPQAMENLQKRQASQALAGVRQNVETPFPGAVLGNPNGKVTLVEFTDFACGYCRQSLGDVAQLIRKNPDLRIVVRELPIISPHSPDAAKMALAAAEQGKYAQFHDAMFAAGQVDGPTIDAVARQVGLDMDRARRISASPTVEAELARNLEIAQRLGFSGTPSWIAGERLIAGAVGIEQLSEAVAAARGN